MSAYTCGSCGFENDSTRVFCQNCGTRLDTSAEGAPAGKLFIPPTQATAPAPAKKQPIKSVRSPIKGQVEGRRRGSVLGKFIALAVWGAILATLIQMARKPEGLPMPAPVDANQASGLYEQVKTAADAPAPREMAVTLDQINNYLAARIVPMGEGEKAIYQARFVRMFVMLGNGDYRLALQQDVLNWPIYIYLNQTPVAAQNGLSVKTTGGGVGRMPVHPALLPFLQKIVAPETVTTIDVLSLLRKASGISVDPQGARFLWSGAAKATP